MICLYPDHLNVDLVMVFVQIVRKLVSKGQRKLDPVPS